MFSKWPKQWNVSQNVPLSKRWTKEYWKYGDILRLVLCPGTMKHFFLEFLFFFHFFFTSMYCTPSFEGTSMCLCWTLRDLMHFSSVIPFKKRNKPKQQQHKTQTQIKSNKQNQNNHQNQKTNTSTKIFIPARTWEKEF